MEPKDLKNSDELKRMEKSDLENAEKEIISDGEDKSVETEKSNNEEAGKSSKPEITETPPAIDSGNPGEEQEANKSGNGSGTDVKSEPDESTAVTAEKEKNSDNPDKEINAKEAPGSTLSEAEKSGPSVNEPEQKEGVEEVADEKAEPENEKAEQPEAAKKSEDKAERVVRNQVKAPKKEKPDYNKLNQVELVNALRDVLENDGEHDVKEEVDAIRSAFYKQRKEEIEAQKKEFIAEGGDEEEFEAEENPYEQDIKDLLKKYRQLRIDFNKKLEVEKEENLKLKYEIIEDIKGLINKEESINKTFNDFRELQQEWREIGLVPQSKMKDLWETYHFHVENFYDYIKINKELRDLDLRKNMEMKITLCEQAEELLVEPNIVKAFNTLQKLHERWREIGPVPRENKDDLWERFKASTSKINKKHQEYFEDRKSEQKKNLEAKKVLCEKVEEINEIDFSSHKEWDEKSREVIKLQKVWRTIGFAPRKDNNRIYDRFRKACDTFFDAKREYYSKNKELQQNNLQQKIDLCVQAEALKDSTDWKKTTQDFINIQKRWKEIGPVSRKQSDAVWKRFRAACDYFFEKKSEHFSSIDSEQTENLKNKEQLVEDIQQFKSTNDVNENLKILKDFQRRWTEIGHVPIKKKDEIQRKFREAINKLYDELDLDETKNNLLKFRTKMLSFSESSRGQNKMRLERDKYMNKLKQLENDLVLLDNNIGFFAKSKNAESLIDDVNKKIEQTREKIEFLKDKIRVIDEMDESEE